jgi:hypothetical protein
VLWLVILVLGGVVGVERLVYKRKQVAFTKQRGGGMNGVM